MSLMNAQSQMRKQTLRVVARPIWFGNRDRDLPGQSCEQDRALHLSARDRTRVRKRAELPAAYRERKPVTPFLYVRTHLSKWLGHAPHRAAAQRRISGQRRCELLAGQDPEHQSGCSAGIAAIQPGVG